VSVFDVGQEDGTPYIVMELLEGRPLRAYVGDASVLLRTKLAWLLAVARVLAAAHEHGLVHRDVKPENVVVGADGEIKVLDFGMASTIYETAAWSFKTRRPAASSSPSARRARPAATVI
jgi:serine/threonine-protein kinase